MKYLFHSAVFFQDLPGKSLLNEDLLLIPFTEFTQAGGSAAYQDGHIRHLLYSLLM